MKYKFITFKESEEFLRSLKKGEVATDSYVVDREFVYAVIYVLGNQFDIEFFKSLEGCKKYIDGEMTAEAVKAWEEKRAIRKERIIYILYYLLIFSMVLLLLYLIKI